MPGRWSGWPIGRCDIRLLWQPIRLMASFWIPPGQIIFSVARSPCCETCSPPRRRGLHCVGGCCGQLGAAHALARSKARPLAIAEPGILREAIGPLPLRALRLDPTMVAELRARGFSTVADLLAQPRAPLVLRSGRAIGGIPGRPLRLGE